MEKFTYKNKQEQEIEIKYGGNYILDTYDGLTAAEIIPATSRGHRQQGSTFNYANIGTRIINLYFYLHSNSMVDFYEKRRNLAAVFNPLLGEGTLTYTNDYTTKQIVALPTVLPTPIERYGTLQLLNVELTAFDPFWYDTAAVTTTFSGNSATVVNNSDWLTPITVEITGVVSNPQIKLNATNELIKVNRQAAAGEKIILRTGYGVKGATHSTSGGVITNINNTIDNSSTFFLLAVGNNQLTFSATSGTPTVKVIHQNRFVGV